MSLPRREGSRDTREGLIISKYPDVCRSPKCPVPYTIVAYQSDDANTAATVRMTGQRAHKQNSIVTKCSGDEAGVGLGVKSNTVGSICHRKGHSNNVRIEGQWATRHGDPWYMNNRNTEGVLNWYTGNRSYDPTPPLAAPASAPTSSSSSRSASGAVMSDAAPEAAFGAPGTELAFLDTTGQFTSPQTQSSPQTQTGTAPATTGGNSPISPPPSSSSPEGRGNQWWSRAWALVPRGGISGPAAMEGMARVDYWLKRNVNSPLDWWDRGVRRPQPTPAPYDPNAPQVPTNQRDSESSPAHAVPPTTQTDTITDERPAFGRTDGNISVEEQGRRRRRNCRLRPYSEGCLDAMPYSTPHHVTPDRVFRHPGETTLYPGGISHGDGLSICVEGGTPIRSGPNVNEHGLIHAIVDPGEAKLGASSTPRGIATLIALEENGANGASLITGCDAEVMKREVRRYHQNKGLGPETKFRADPYGRINPDSSSLGTRVVRGNRGL